MSSAAAAQRVLGARGRQHRRAGKLNADLTSGDIQQHCRLDRNCRRLLAQAHERLNLSARSMHRVLRVARTIADLEMADQGDESGPAIAATHLAEALQLRRAL